MPQRATHPRLALTAMLIAALCGYIGLPQLDLQLRLNRNVLAAATQADFALRVELKRRLAEAAPGSAEARELKQRQSDGRRALDTLADAPNDGAVNAPVLTSRTDAPRSTPPDVPAACWLALMEGGCNSFAQPPPEHGISGLPPRPLSFDAPACAPRGPPHVAC